MKSQVTKETLFQEILKNGLYAFLDLNTHASPIASYAICLSAPCTYTASILNNCGVNFIPWHARLGQRSKNIVQHVLNICNIPHELNKVNFVYKSCRYGKSYQLPFPTSNSIYL